MAHSSLSNRLDHGEHEGYRPGAYDPIVGITNPEAKAYVRGFYNRDDHVRWFLADLKPFTAHSIRGWWEEYPNGDRCYVVYSYSTEIASWYVRKHDPNDPGRDLPIVQISATDYGQVTREHKGLVLSYLGRNVDRDIAPTPIGG